MAREVFLVAQNYLYSLQQMYAAFALCTHYAVMQLRDLKVRHGLEMDQIQVKLQGVLQKKDATISGLRAELQAVAHKLSQTEQLLQEQLEDMRDGML